MARRSIFVVALFLSACGGWPRAEKKSLVAKCVEGGVKEETCRCRYDELEREYAWKDYQAKDELSRFTIDTTADLRCVGKKLQEMLDGTSK